MMYAVYVPLHFYTLARTPLSMEFRRFLRSNAGRSRRRRRAGSCHIQRIRAMRAGFSARGVLLIEKPRAHGNDCQITGCKNDSPPALAEQRLCVLHFTLALESSCGEMRRETALGK